MMNDERHVVGRDPRTFVGDLDQDTGRTRSGAAGGEGDAASGR